jgi:excisionase family DNA binding protein
MWFYPTHALGGKNYLAENGMSEERLTYAVDEAGKLLGLSRNTAYTLAKTGQLPTVRLGRRLLVPKAALERLLTNLTAA